MAIKKQNKKSIIKLIVSALIIGAIILTTYLILRRYGLTDLSREEMVCVLNSDIGTGGKKDVVLPELSGRSVC